MNPSYYSLGDHAETIQIDFDPARISYGELLDVFWASHEPVTRQWSRQYMSMIHYHNDEQQRAARELQAREETRRKTKLFTEIVPAGKFYLAEDYHQKHYLRQARELLNEFLAIYPRPADLISSTAAARVNGYAGRYGTLEGLKAEIDTLGLSSAGRERLLQIVSRSTVSLR